MRTTLDLDLDVLDAAKEIAATQGKSAGQVVSELLRAALSPTRHASIRNGVPLFPKRRHGSSILTMARVNELRDVE